MMNIGADVGRRIEKVLALAAWVMIPGTLLLVIRGLWATPWLGSDFLPSVNSLRDLLAGQPLESTFVYPPGLLAFLLPMTFFGQGRQVAWIVVTAEILGLGISFWAMMRMLGQRATSLPTALVALALTLSGQLFYALALANLNLILIPLEALFYLAASKGRWNSAGMLLGLSLTIKPVLIPFVVLLLWNRRWRATALSIALPLLTSILVLLASRDPVQIIRRSVVVVSVASAQENVNIQGIGQILALPGWVTHSVRGALVLVIGLAAFRLWRSSMPTLDSWIWITQLLLCCLMLCFFFAHTFYALSFVPLVLLAARTPGLTSSRVVFVSALLAWGPWPIGGLVFQRYEVTATLICLGMVAIVVASWLAAGEYPDEHRSGESAVATSVL